MSRRKFRIGALAAVAALSVLALPGSASAGGPGVWSQIGTTDQGADTLGALRTADKNLHLVWLGKRASNNTQSYYTATLSVAGRVLVRGTALSGWQSLEGDPQLVPDGSGIRLIFEGNTGAAGCYHDGAIFTETSANGATWNLVNGSLSAHTAGVGGIAATAQLNGTPVAAFGEFGLFHVGVDPSCPASTPDGMIPLISGNTPSNPAIVTDTRTGAVWVATYQAFSKQGYWVDQLLPSQGPAIEAPGSAASAAHNNQPLEPVALAARIGGGVYMAYCIADSREPCAHVDMWKVGTSRVMVVPGSQHVNGARVAIAADTLGNISVAWYDSTKNVIHSVRTNPSVTRWGAVRTTRPPAHTSAINDLQADGSSARLDLLAVVVPSTAGTPLGLFQTQVLPGLTLTATPLSFSHKKSKRVTFTVTDAGQPISAAFVSCLGKHGTTNRAGKITLKFRKGTPPGKHLCTAAHVDYAVGTVDVKVT